MGLSTAKRKDIELPPAPELPSAKGKGSNAPPDDVPVLADALPITGGSQLFLFPALQQRLITLVHMVDQGKSIILVIGDFGSGKSTLAEHCERESWRDKVLVHINAVQDFTVRDLIKAVACATGANKPNITFQALCKHLTDQSETLNHLLVIDDAHNLSQDNLRAILCLKKILTPKSAKFGIVLFSEPDIKQSLIHNSLLGYTDGWATFIYLPRLNEQDVSFYVEDRMIQCGFKLRKPHGKHLKAMHQASGGLPMRINEILAREALDHKDPSILHGVFGSTRRTLLLLGLLATVAAFYQHWPDLSRSLTHFLGIDLLQPQHPVTKPSTTIELPPSAHSRRQSVPPQTLDGTLSIQPNSSAPTQTELDAAHMAVVATQDESSTPTIPVNAVTELIFTPETMPAADQADPVATHTQTQTVNAPGPKPTATLAPRQVLDNLSGNAWLRSQNAQAYTIQLFGSYNEQALLQLLKKKNVGDSVAYLRLVVNDYEWHILIQGIYPSSMEAEHALANLPAHLKKAHPWVRSIGSLQALLNKPSS